MRVAFDQMTNPGTVPAQRDRRTQQNALRIQIGTGVGRAATSIAAFDAALREVGVADFNLIRLSSVIPAASEIQQVGRIDQRGQWGDRLFCVYAEHRSEDPGQGVAAGVGWALRPGGAGLFVEHHGDSEDAVTEEIRASLADMTGGRGGGFAPPRISVVSAVCEQQPVCAIALAAYQTLRWT